MKKILKYLSIFALAFVFTFSTFLSTSSAKSPESSEGYLTPEQVVELNLVLEELKNEANKKLENGSENFTVSSDVSFSDTPVSFTFDSQNENSDVELLNSESQDNTASSLAINALASQEKSYTATVSNTAGFNFSHRLYGSFVYGNGKVSSYTKYAELVGAMYYKSHDTTGVVLDPSVIEVHSDATFEAFRYFTEYKTLITIRLLGSGDYRVTELKIVNPA